MPNPERALLDFSFGELSGRFAFRLPPVGAWTLDTHLGFISQEGRRMFDADLLASVTRAKGSPRGQFSRLSGSDVVIDLLEEALRLERTGSHLKPAPKRRKK